MDRTEKEVTLLENNKNTFFASIRRLFQSLASVRLLVLVFILFSDICFAHTYRSLFASDLESGLISARISKINFFSVHQKRNRKILGV